MFKAILPVGIGVAIGLGLLAFFFIWELSCKPGAWARDFSACKFWTRENPVSVYKPH